MCLPWWIVELSEFQIGAVASGFDDEQTRDGLEMISTRVVGVFNPVGSFGVT